MIREILPKQLSEQDVFKRAKTGKNNTKTLVQSNKYKESLIDSLFTYNIYLKIKELWVTRWKIAIQLDLLSNRGGIF